MDLISSKWRKPKGRPSKRRKASIANSRKRWSKMTDAVLPLNNKENDSQIAVELPLQETNVMQQNKKIEGIFRKDDKIVVTFKRGQNHPEREYLEETSPDIRENIKEFLEEIKQTLEGVSCGIKREEPMENLNTTQEDNENIQIKIE